MAEKPPQGSIVWRDLTVAEATPLKAFYEAVVGWTSSEVAMPGYVDYAMADASGETVAGVCHARGTNAAIPPMWIMYVSVSDVRAAADRAVALGGQVVDGPRPMGGALFALVRDPAGAVFALYEAS